MKNFKKYLLLSKFLRFLKKFPISLNGAILLSISIWALYSIGIKKQDLIVSLLCSCIVTVIIILTLLCIIYSSKLKQKITFSLTSAETNTYSNVKNFISALIDNSSIPAFFNLKLRCNFYPQDLEVSELIISGESAQTRHCLISANFPHRGFWQLNSVKMEFADALGFSRRTWKIPLKKTIRVMPQPTEIQALNLMASSSKPGDEINLPQERSGDPFDIKPYENSDGVKRILWKTYARSRQLLVKRPELAIIPEGEIAIYLIADKKDDNTAAACMSQIKSLIQNDLLVIFSSDLSQPKIEKNYDKIEDLILKAALDPLAGSGKGLESFIAELKEKNYNLNQINIFASSEMGYLDNLSKQAAGSGIKINLIIVENAKKPKQKFRINLSDFEVNYVKSYA